MVEATFLIPIEFGSSVKWDAIETGLRLAYGGFTRCPDVYGEWTDENGDVVTDASREYRVAMQEDQLLGLQAWLAEQAVSFGQKCIYLAVSAERVFFVS